MAATPLAELILEDENFVLDADCRLKMNLTVKLSDKYKLPIYCKTILFSPLKALAKITDKFLPQKKV